VLMKAVTALATSSGSSRERCPVGVVTVVTPYRRRWDEVNRYTARKSYPANPTVKKSY
jgi:hypothetical protein